MGQDVDAHNLDLQTVRLFHLLMPANSSYDARTICESIRKFEAFPHVHSPSVRQNLQVRVLSCERIITLKSFHRDTILLEGCYQPLRSLFQVEETTLRAACEAVFTLDPRYFRANKIDLWLYVMRNYPWLSDHSSAGRRAMRRFRSSLRSLHLVASATPILVTCYEDTTSSYIPNLWARNSRNSAVSRPIFRGTTGAVSHGLVTSNTHGSICLCKVCSKHKINLF